MRTATKFIFGFWFGWALFCCPCLGQYQGGTGTPADPYQIAKDFEWKNLTQTPADWDKHYILIDDIDFKGVIIDPIGTDSNISNYDYDGPWFAGSLNGNKHTLSNLVISRPNGYCIGLFGFLGPGAVVHNLTIKNIQVTGRLYTGGLAGVNGGTITDCSITGQVCDAPQNGLGYVGGMVGYNYGGALTNCSTQVQVVGRPDGGYDYLGGLAAINYYGTITHCSSGGAVNPGKLSYRFVGGLVGDNIGAIKTSYATGAVSGSCCVGGLAGGQESGQISACYASGDIMGYDSTGGLVGHNAGVIENCYARGSLDKPCFYTSGGLVGDTSTKSVVKKCYATGRVNALDQWGREWNTAGGLIGINWDTTFANVTGCFWDTDSSVRLVSQGGAGLKTGAMQSDPNIYCRAGWDFIGETNNGTQDLWIMSPGYYPILTITSGQLVLEAKQGHYYTIPGHAENDYTIRLFDETARATVFGTSVIPVKLTLAGINAAAQTFRIQSEYADTIRTTGLGIIEFPEYVLTDAQGVAQFEIRIKDLYKYEYFGPTIELPPLLQRIIFKVTGGPDNQFTAELELPLLDNYQELEKRYETDIPVGLVRENYNLLNPIEKRMVDIGYLAGALNNALSLLGKEEFDPYTCGAYQVHVLYWLDTMRLSPEHHYLLNGFDYGPVRQLFGAHLAAQLWPQGMRPFDLGWGRILDPWITQTPEGGFYTYPEWFTTIGLSMPIIGQILDSFIQSGTNIQQLSPYYPNCGKPYPPQPISCDYSPDILPKLSVIVDCPVYVMITDPQGRRTGHLLNVPEGANPWISEIPGVNYYSFGLPDGSQGSFFELPDGDYDVQVNPYQSGESTVYLLKDGDPGVYHTPVANENNGQMELDTSAAHLPIMTFADGRVILPDGMLHFGQWFHYPRINQVSAQLTLSNTCMAPLTGPLRVVLAQTSSSGITLVKPDFITADGRPGLNMPLPKGQTALLPGQAVSVNLTLAPAGQEPFDVTLDMSLALPQGNATITARASGVQPAFCGDNNHPQPAGDYNQDCRVNLDDLSLLAGCWLQTAGASHCTGLDGNNDQLIALPEIVLVAQNWLDCSAPQPFCPAKP